MMRFRGKRVAFADRQSAVREAILEAFEHSRNGTPTRVVCINDHLDIEVVWTYGVDPNPASRLARPPTADLHPHLVSRRRPSRAPVP
jgi:hypothetical protein